MFYLINGRINRSLRTKVRRFAEARLDQYVRGKFGLGPKMTVKEYYEQWIETKRAPMVRRSAERDYRQSFKKYILPELSDMQMQSISVSILNGFRQKLLRLGLSMKTAKNILGNFRALWRDAMADELVDKNPFAVLKWPRVEQLPPDPFTAEEREKILAVVCRKQPVYYPFVYTMFHTGMRPSEAAALRFSDLNLERRTISITKSRHLGADAALKTAHSRRVISVSQELMDLVEAIRLPWQEAADPVFYNTSGTARDVNGWARAYWKWICDTADVRYRKFYATRHTFITEAVCRGENLKAIADYCGTSIAMIEKNYCGVLELGQDQTVFKPSAPKSLESLASPTGFEPVTKSKDKFPNPLNPKLLEQLRKRKVR